MTSFKLPLNQCLMLAKQRVSDAAYEMDQKGADAATVGAALLNEAREFLAAAKEQGWDGDVEATIAAHLAVYR